jgi:hypothetical protein
MPNLALKSEFETTSNIFSGEWIAWLDAITHRSFIQEAGEEFLNKFASHAYETNISRDDLSSVTGIALNFLAKHGLKPLDITYFHDGIDGGVSIEFNVDRPDDVCLNYYDLLVKEMVTQCEDFNFELITFNISSYVSDSDANKAY